MSQPRRILALIDGYNLYHGLSDPRLSGHNNKETAHYYKWLDLKKLIAQFAPEDSHIIDVVYFTAYAYWRNLDTLHRHRAYVRALTNIGVRTVFGQFKQRDKKCRKCNRIFQTHEEKETDVNIAVEMIDAAHRDIFDDLYLVSGDTDLASPIRKIKKDFPNKHIQILFPPFRSNLEMRGLGHDWKQIKRRHLKRALLPARMKPKKGQEIVRPEKYNPPAL